MPVKLLSPKRWRDDRGWLVESYSESWCAAFGITDRFRQDNHSFSSAAYALRGLHYQAASDAQAKLIRCTRGRIWDVAVDIRRGSPTFGRWVAAELSADNGWQLYVPVGFAHGFLTLEPGTEVAYKLSNLYSVSAERGVRWDDARIGLPWPLPPGRSPILSQKDGALPALVETDSGIDHAGSAMTEFGELTTPSAPQG